jgi:hypothetical protein
MMRSAFKHSPKGYRAIRKMPEVQAELLRLARERAKMARTLSGGGNFISDVQLSRNRAVAMIKTGDAKAVRENARNNILLKVRNA